MSRTEHGQRMAAMLHSRPHSSPRVHASVEIKLVPYPPPISSPSLLSLSLGSRV
jgi:hypothetical protein